MVNVARRLCDMVRERVDDFLFVTERCDCLEGIRKDEMENGFTLHAMLIAATGKQATSERDVMQKIFESPGVVE